MKKAKRDIEKGYSVKQMVANCEGSLVVYSKASNLQLTLPVIRYLFLNQSN